MKIYTKYGDGGETSLVFGKRVSKSNLRIEAYGTVDELNAWIGKLNDDSVNSDRRGILTQIQNKLFDIGTQLACEKENNNFAKINESDIALIELEIDKIESKLAPLSNFILPGGHSCISEAHITRTVCRRAERLVVQLSEIEVVEQNIIKYINRLSDYLFVLARVLAMELGIKETIWKG